MKEAYTFNKSAIAIIIIFMLAHGSDMYFKVVMTQLATFVIIKNKVIVR